MGFRHPLSHTAGKAPPNVVKLIGFRVSAGILLDCGTYTEVSVMMTPIIGIVSWLRAPKFT